MRKYSHVSPKLERLLYCRVRIVFTDGDTVEGILSRSQYWSGRYQVRYLEGCVHFSKSLVRRVEEL